MDGSSLGWVGISLDGLWMGKVFIGAKRALEIINVVDYPLKMDVKHVLVVHFRT